MKIKKILALYIILLFIGIAVAPTINFNTVKASTDDDFVEVTTRSYTKHRLIIINENNDLTPENGVVSGTGTNVDPYIISGWEFDGSTQYLIDKIRWKSIFHQLLIALLFGVKESAISISNTDKYIIIRDNYFVDWNEPTPPPDPYGHSPRPDHMAIAIGNAKNIVIENNIISNCNEGISCSSLAIIRNNSFFSIKDGWEAVSISAQGTIVENNVFQDCDVNSCIYFLYADNTTIIRNNSLKNIEGYSILGVNGLVENNTLVNCDIAIKVGSSTVQNNLVKSSTIGVASFNQNFISHNDLINNSVGVGCYWPPHNPIIINNTIQGNNWGIYGIEGSQPLVHYNNIFGNNAGLNYKGGRIINATLNWWGASNGPSGTGPGDGDSVSDNVSYNPWLTSPNPDAGR